MSYRGEVEATYDLLEGEYTYTTDEGVRVYDESNVDRGAATVHALLAIAAAIAGDHDRPTGPVRYDG